MLQPQRPPESSACSLLVHLFSASPDEETGGRDLPDFHVSPASALFGGTKNRGQTAGNEIVRALLPGEPGAVGIEDTMTVLSKFGIGVIAKDRGSEGVVREFPVTREHVRQSEAKALRKPSRLSWAHVMRNFAEP